MGHESPHFPTNQVHRILDRKTLSGCPEYINTALHIKYFAPLKRLGARQAHHHLETVSCRHSVVPTRAYSQRSCDTGTDHRAKCLFKHAPYEQINSKHRPSVSVTEAWSSHQRTLRLNIGDINSILLVIELAYYDCYIIWPRYIDYWLYMLVCRRLMTKGVTTLLISNCLLSTASKSMCFVQSKDPRTNILTITA